VPGCLPSALSPASTTCNDDDDGYRQGVSSAGFWEWPAVALLSRMDSGLFDGAHNVIIAAMYSRALLQPCIVTITHTIV